MHQRRPWGWPQPPPSRPGVCAGPQAIASCGRPPWARPPPPAAAHPPPPHPPARPPAAAPAPAFPALGKPLVKEDDFPDLSVAAKVKESKKEKKKKQTMNLNEFLKSDVGGGGGPAPAFGARRGGGGGDVDLMSLPTAPRQRAEGEEAPSRHLGGGFREYGGEARCCGVPTCTGVGAAGAGRPRHGCVSPRAAVVANADVAAQLMRSS